MQWIRAGGSAPADQAFPAYRPRVEEQSPELEKRLADETAEWEARVRAARDVGYREGEQAGLAQERANSRAHVEQAVQELAAAIRDLDKLRPRLRREAELDLVRLAVAIARRIVNRELATDPEAVVGIARVAFEKLRIQETVRVAVHPDLAKPLRSALERTAAGHVEVAADPSLARGSVIFETARGNLDLSVETQLREIEQGLTDRLRVEGK
jgi:flagellar assembly protein FliH